MDHPKDHSLFGLGLPGYIYIINSHINSYVGMVQISNHENLCDEMPN